jgi:hypothetical protein
MKKLVTVLTLLLLTLSISGCLGGVNLEEGQTHGVFNKDGELTYTIAYEDDVLVELYDVEIDDDEDDIMDAISDFFDDADIDMELTKVKIDEKNAIITMVFEDFEVIYHTFYEKFEDLADNYGDYDDLNDELEFKYFKNDEDIDEDDLEEYEDGFPIYVAGGEEGAYYEFDSNIVVVSDVVDYEKINTKTIYIEDGEEGWIVVSGEIDSDPDDIVNSLNGVDIEEEQSSYVLNKDSELTMVITIDEDDLDDIYDADFDDSVKEITEDLEDFLDDVDSDGEIKNIKKKDDYIELTLFFEDAEDQTGDIYTLEDEADWYDDMEDYADDNPLVYFKSGDDVDEDDFEDYEDYLILSVWGGEEGAYFEVPSEIELVSDRMDYERINNNTIFVEDGESGIIVFDEY